MLANVGPTLANVGPSVVFCCPFHGQISETEQDRPIVTVEHYIDDCTTDSVAVFRTSRSWFQINNMFTY